MLEFGGAGNRISEVGMFDSQIYARRGLPFDVNDYPEPTRTLLKEKLRTVEDIVRDLPRSFRIFCTFAAGQPRGLMRQMGERHDWADVTYAGALTFEPYRFMAHPGVQLWSPYYSPVDRAIAHTMGKTVALIPKNYGQLEGLGKQPGLLDYVGHAATPPDADGWLNLGVNCDLMQPFLDHFGQMRPNGARLIVEINSHMPWVCGDEASGGNRVHLSQVDFVYENHEPLPQVAPIKASSVEERIGQNVLPFIEDGDTLQLGIGGLPGYIATHLRDRRGLKVHTEMLNDAYVDLDEAGAIDCSGKAWMDGRIVGTFAAGTDRLYDWLDRNPRVALMPIGLTNDPYSIGRNRRLKSVNSCLMVDLHGQICSDAVGFRQLTGIGGQGEFVMGAQRSEGGRSILCLKSTRNVRGHRMSTICATLPPGTPVTVTRHYADVIVTEYGAAEVRYLEAIGRARALVGIAHPDFQQSLIGKAEKVGLWDRKPGFATFKQRAIYNNAAQVGLLKKAIAKHPDRKGRILMAEVKKAIAQPGLFKRLVAFYKENAKPME